MSTQILTRAEQFFYDNAGYSWDSQAGQSEEDGHLESARKLAKAERDANEAGIRFNWIPDEDGCIGCECGDDACPCFTGEPHEVFICYAYEFIDDRFDRRQVRASLGSICQPSASYARVVEAELALEALQNI